MGQKVNPNGLRVGVIKDWDNRWYADKKDFSRFLVEDYQIREFVNKHYQNAGISQIILEREGADKVILSILTAKPGVIIGRQGAEIEVFKNLLTKKFKRQFFVNVRENKNPDCDAILVAESIAKQLEDRVSFRKAVKQAIGRAMKQGAKGIKVQTSGRLGGAEIARSESYHEGTIPLHTLRADIDYALAEAHTIAGIVGVKVWIYKGEVIPSLKPEPKRTEQVREGGQG